MDQNVSMIKEILIRLGIESPKLFKKIQNIALVLTIFMAGLIATSTALPENTQLKEVIKWTGIIGGIISTTLGTVAKLPVANKEELEEKIEIAAKKEDEETGIV